MSEHHNTSTDHVNGLVIGNSLTPFSWLPNYIVNNPAYPPDVVAVALYLHGKTPGWIARPSDIQKRMG